MNDFTPHPYQQDCINAILERPSVALWLEMGLGKTVITLTAIEELLYNRYTVDRVLVIAPKRVAEATWQREAARWIHTSHLRFSAILGNLKERKAALASQADIYIVNRENVQWLVGECGRNWPFDMVVIDEASSFKNHSAQRFKALKRVRPRIHKVVELTGTPAPNNLLDIWAQIYLLDQGERLGKYYTHYRRDWFEPDQYGGGGQVYKWTPRKGADKCIKQAISDLIISLQAADHLELPERIVEDIPVVLDSKAAQDYKRLERNYLLELDGVEVTAQQAAALSNKLMQLCNGGVYDTEHTAHEVHRCKLEAFSELIERLGGQKCLVFYAFEFDKESILRELKTAHKGLVARVLSGPQDEADWNAGKIDVLLAHPASCAYGLNLQEGGRHIIWYGLTWNLELYEQANARLHRQGQKHPVIIHRLLVQGRSEDQRAAQRLEQKNTTQRDLVQGVKELIKAAKEDKS